MSDQSCTIKITFDYQGKKFKTDMNVNYFADSECEGVDQRVIDFFRESYKEGMNRYRKVIDEYRAKQDERLERETLERLQKKYSSKPPTK